MTWLEQRSDSPEQCGVLAVFAGRRAHLRSFARMWLSREDTELLAVELDPAAIPWCPQRAECACAVFVGRVPRSSFMQGWLRNQRKHGWRLFYWEGQVSRVPVALDLAGTRVPRGPYLRWHYRSANGGFERPEPGYLLVVDREGPLKLKMHGDFMNFFALYSLVGHDAVGLKGLGPRIAAEATPEDAPPYMLPIRLQAKLEGRTPDNAAYTLARLQRRITELQEQAEYVQWWTEEHPEVYMHVYPERQSRIGAGSVWELRDWFWRAGDAVLRQFEHCRVVVEGLGPLHLVRPADLTGMPDAALPRSAYRLQLDQHWWEKPWRGSRRAVFVSCGLELWPPPPRNNAHLENLMAEKLWEGASQEETLVVLERPGSKGQREVFRFTAAGFRSLSGQAQALNFQLAQARAERDPAAENADGVSRVLGSVQDDLDRRFQGLRAALEQQIEALWSGDRAELDRYHDQVRQALEELEGLKRRLQDVARFRQTHRTEWVQFRDAVLALDRMTVPEEANALRGEIARLDEIRARLIESWQDESGASRRAAAAELQQLAGNVFRLQV